MNFDIVIYRSLYLDFFFPLGIGIRCSEQQKGLKHFPHGHFFWISDQAFCCCISDDQLGKLLNKDDFSSLCGQDRADFEFDF